MNYSNCSVCREAIASIVSGDFTKEDRIIVDIHTKRCADCAEDFRQLLEMSLNMPKYKEEDFTNYADTSARLSINSIHYISQDYKISNSKDALSFLRTAAIILISFGIGIVTVLYFPDIKGTNNKNQNMSLNEASNAVYNDFLERSHLLLIGSALYKPECSEQNHDIESHQRRISIELLIESQNIRQFYNMQLRPQDVKLLEYIEAALVHIAGKETRYGNNSVREESAVAVCELSKRLGI